MMSWSSLRSASLVILLLGLASIAGCAQEREPINRVQADALAKSFFVGNNLADPGDDPEFLTQATLIDVGYGAGQDGLFTSTYAQGQARIKWEIDEELLIARLTYERIADSDGKGAGPASMDGQVVAAYRIVKHFDIRRAYNPTTGEDLNIVEENDYDRVWYEREYFRVDWSKNLNVDAYDFDTLSLMGLFGGIEYTPLDYYVNDPHNEDAPYFDVDRGYFDVTNKAFAAPGMIDLSSLGWGIDAFPACFLPDELMGGSWPAGNCNPVELTIRQAFVRVKDTDYEPAEWDGWRFQAFGGFYTERLGYSRNFGMSDDKWHRLLDRYNIYERSHYYRDPQAMTGPIACYTSDTLSYGEDPHADVDQDGTEDRCWTVVVELAVEGGLCSSVEAASDPQGCYQRANPVYGGSRCDTFKQRCTLPYRQRAIKPIVWYYTSKSNLEFFDATEWATHEHDVAMRHAIMTARYAECMATAKDRALCLGGDLDSGGKMAPNPVYFGQMDDHLEARQLAQEVDDCRHGLSYPDYGAVNGSEREKSCQTLADSVADARRAAGAVVDAGVVALAKMPEQIVLCHSPVEIADPAACAPADQRLASDLSAADCQRAREDRDSATVGRCKEALSVRIGDMRFHNVNVIKPPQTPSPWGIYTDAHDPLTGETYSASINVWSHVNDLWSQLVMDRIRYIKGELPTEEITSGQYVRDWAEASEAANGGGMAPRIDRKEFDRRIAAFAGTSAAQVAAIHKADVDPVVYAKTRALREEIRDVRAEVGAPSTMAPVYAARAEQAQGTSFEAQLVSPAMQELAGVGELPAGDFASDRASILRGLNPAMRKQLRQFYEQGLAARGSCIYEAAPAPVAVTGLADVLERKFENVCALAANDGGCAASWGRFGEAPPAEVLGSFGLTERDFQEARADAMRRYLGKRAHYGVIAHEMGHSVGMRHNFVSSSDAFSYRPQYWQLRTDDGAVSRSCGCAPGQDPFATECGDYEEDGSACVGPRYWDPVDQHERDDMIWMWMHSSTMDYAGEYTQDMLGLGGWDFGADRMFYGESVAVFDDPSYSVGQDRAPGLLYKMDSFGGILGFAAQFNGEDIHYSSYQRDYELIRDCTQIDAAAYRPASWDEASMGQWDPLFDGLIVANSSGQATKCRQQPVDYQPWQSLHYPADQELTDVPYYRGGPSVDLAGRIRVPYGFGTDRWADIGNASVYRHDNGADTYEIFDFLITQQEINHIFDNYRRWRQSFSVRGAANRTLGRYNEKIRDGAKGLGLLANIYRDFAAQNGWVFDNGYWAYIARLFFPDNVVSATMTFDHFVRTAQRPEPGGHYLDGGVLWSVEDSYANNPSVVVNVPDGATGYFGDITAGGKLIENRLCGDVYGGAEGASDGCGEFDSDYTMNAGSYYDKVFAPYLLAESVDNFISDRRGDFVDGRYRAISLADLFPDGYRRWLGNALTDDEAFKGPHLAADAAGKVLVGNDGYPAWPIGWTSFWGEEPSVCFPAYGSTVCGTFAGSDNFGADAPERTVPLSSEIGWEVQKFLVAQTLLWLPSNEKDRWISQLRVWQLGPDANPDVDNRIELHDPEGNVYIAKTFGKETLLAGTDYEKMVQKGIAARVLEYANELLVRGYETDPVDWDGDGQPDWYIARVTSDGKPIVLWDPDMRFVNANGQLVSTIPGCDGVDNSECPCSANTACTALADYVSVPFYLRQAVAAYGLADPEMQGVWE